MREAPSSIGNVILPENSQGHMADNPDIFDMWSTGDGIAPAEWPYLMLCKDQTNGRLTWHMLCNEQNIPRLITMEMKALIDDHISNERDRDLVGIELLCRRGNQHMFLAK